jgi:hypothetical protein
LRAVGIEAAGWDPFFAPEVELRAADVVTLGYVINVIEDMDERVEVLRRAFALARNVLIVAVRIENGIAGVPAGNEGSWTGAGTFQKFFTQSEFLGLLARKFGGGIRYNRSSARKVTMSRRRLSRRATISRLRGWKSWRCGVAITRLYRTPAFLLTQPKHLKGFAGRGRHRDEPRPLLVKESSDQYRNSRTAASATRVSAGVGICQLRDLGKVALRGTELSLGWDTARASSGGKCARSYEQAYLSGNRSLPA